MCGPSCGKLESKNIFFHSCFLQVVCAAQSVSCSKKIQISTMHTSRCLLMHLFFAIILIDGVYS